MAASGDQGRLLLRRPIHGHIVAELGQHGGDVHEPKVNDTCRCGEIVPPGIESLKEARDLGA